jgi:hypothetical protein
MTARLSWLVPMTHATAGLAPDAHLGPRVRGDERLNRDRLHARTHALLPYAIAMPQGRGEWRIWEVGQ